MQERFLNFPVGLPPRVGPPADRYTAKPIGAAGYKGVARQKNGRYQERIF